MVHSPSIKKKKKTHKKPKNLCPGNEEGVNFLCGDFFWFSLTLDTAPPKSVTMLEDVFFKEWSSVLFSLLVSICRSLYKANK